MMRPLAVFTGILLGSFLSITVSLAAVLLIFTILSGDYPRLANEFGALATSALIFLSLTIIAALSFYTVLKAHRSRWWLQAMLWSGILATTAWFWP